MVDQCGRLGPSPNLVIQRQRQWHIMNSRTYGGCNGVCLVHQLDKQLVTPLCMCNVEHRRLKFSPMVYEPSLETVVFGALHVGQPPVHNYTQLLVKLDRSTGLSFGCVIWLAAMFGIIDLLTMVML